MPSAWPSVKADVELARVIKWRSSQQFSLIAPEFRQLTAMTTEWAYFFQFSARCLPATTVRNGSFPPRLVPHIFALFVKE
jgi:hypothetical protein